MAGILTTIERDCESEEAQRSHYDSARKSQQKDGADSVCRRRGRAWREAFC